MSRMFISITFKTLLRVSVMFCNALLKGNHGNQDSNKIEHDSGTTTRQEKCNKPYDHKVTKITSIQFRNKIKTVYANKNIVCTCYLSPTNIMFWCMSQFTLVYFLIIQHYIKKNDRFVLLLSVATGAAVGFSIVAVGLFVAVVLLVGYVAFG